MAQSRAINDPRFAGSSLRREMSVMFVRTLIYIGGASAPPQSGSAQ